MLTVFDYVFLMCAIIGCFFCAYVLLSRAEEKWIHVNHGHLSLEVIVLGVLALVGTAVGLYGVAFILFPSSFIH